MSYIPLMGSIGQIIKYLKPYGQLANHYISHSVYLLSDKRGTNDLFCRMV